MTFEGLARAMVSSGKGRALLAAGPPLVIYGLLTATYLGPRSMVRNLDFWSHVQLGQRIVLFDLETLVDGFYPIGYPLLLRVAIDAGMDALRVGQALSCFGGLVALLSVGAIAARFTRSTAWTLLAGLVLISSASFMDLATREGTDMLAAGLQLACVAGLLYARPYAGWNGPNVALVAAAGLALGLGYMVRYTALLVFPCALASLLAKFQRSGTARWVALFVGTFVLGGGLQIGPSLLGHGQPFYNLQAKNVWFGVYGGWDWVDNWRKVPDTIAIWEIVSTDPGRFLAHWLEEIGPGLLSSGLWSPALQTAWVLGALALAFDRRSTAADRLLFVSALVLPVAITAMAWLSPRFLLVAIALQAVSIAALFQHIWEALARMRRLPIALGLGLIVVGLLADQFSGVASWFGAPIDTRPEDVNRLLRFSGMEDPTRVATNDPYLHATDVPARTSYSQVYALVPRPTTVESLLDHPEAGRWRYLVLNFETGLGDYSDLRDDLLANSRLVPLSVDPSATIFRIKGRP